MKKTIKSLLSFFIVLVITMSVFTFNASAASVNIGGAGEYEIGKNFSVTIKFNADATLYAVEADVSYNSSVLRLNSVSGADYNIGNGSVKIVDDGFSATTPSKTSSYTLNFTAIAAGNSNISASLLGGGEAESKASSSIAISVVAPKPSSDANLSSIRLSSGALSPAFNPNTTNYNATVKYNVDSINITGVVADGKSTYTGGGTFALQVGDNQRTLTVTAQDGTKKSYTINIKRMTEQETAEAEQAARDANPLLVVIGDADYTIVNNLDEVTIPTGFTQETASRKESEITVLNEASGKYQLCWLVDANGENGAFYKRDENDNFTKLAYVSVNDVMYIIEKIEGGSALPLGYTRTTYEIDGASVDAIKYDEVGLADFYIFNCFVPGQTENTLYCYDTVEGTMQRALDYNAAVKAASEQVIEDEVPQNTGKFAWFKNMDTTGKVVFAIIIFTAVLLIAIAVVLIVKIVSSKEDEFEGEYVSDEDSSFVLNDFAEEETPEEPQLQTEEAEENDADQSEE